MGLKMAKLEVVPRIGPILLKQLKTALVTTRKSLLSRLTIKMRERIIIIDSKIFKNLVLGILINHSFIDVESQDTVRDKMDKFDFCNFCEDKSSDHLKTTCS